MMLLEISIELTFIHTAKTKDFDSMLNGKIIICLDGWK